MVSLLGDNSFKGNSLLHEGLVGLDRGETDALARSLARLGGLGLEKGRKLAPKAESGTNRALEPLGSLLQHKLGSVAGKWVRGPVSIEKGLDNKLALQKRQRGEMTEGK